MTTLLTPVSLAALAQDALAVADLPTTQVALTIQVGGRDTWLSFTGLGDGYTPQQAERLARALELSNPQTSATGKSVRGLDPHGIFVQIHQQAQAVPA